MKFLNLKSLLSVAVLFCSVAAFAQPCGGAMSCPKGQKGVNCDQSEMAQKRCEMMAQRLNLSEKQKGALAKLNAEYVAKTKANKESHLAAVMALLNDEQKVEYAKMMKKNGKQGAAQGKMKGGKRQSPRLECSGVPQDAK